MVYGEDKRERPVSYLESPLLSLSLWALSKQEGAGNVCGWLEGYEEGEREVRDQPHYQGEDMERGSGPLHRDQP